MAQNANIEVQVALLRAGMYKKDLAKLLGMDYKTFTNRFYREMPLDLQNGLIDLIESVGSGREPTEEDLDNYIFCVDRMRNFSKRTQAELDERTIAFVEYVEKNNRVTEALDELNDIFCVG